MRHDAVGERGPGLPRRRDARLGPSIGVTAIFAEYPDSRIAIGLGPSAVFPGGIDPGGCYVMGDDNIGFDGTLVNSRGFNEHMIDRILCMKPPIEMRETRQIGARDKTTGGEEPANLYESHHGVCHSGCPGGDFVLSGRQDAAAIQ